MTRFYVEQESASGWKVLDRKENDLCYCRCIDPSLAARIADALNSIAFGAATIRCAMRRVEVPTKWHFVPNPNVPPERGPDRVVTEMALGLFHGWYSWSDEPRGIVEMADGTVTAFQITDIRFLP